MSVITYYLGAGASANCIPVNSDFPKAVGNFARNFILSSQRFRSKGIDFNKLKGDIESFEANVKSNPTVDIFALKLYLQGEPLLIWFKACLELFFLYCQYINPPDYRYEFFLASFINQGNGVPKLNDNVNVITWNYDNQIELAYSRYINYTTDSSFLKLQRWLRVFPYYGSHQNRTLTLSKYNIVKLNGGVGLQKPGEYKYYYSGNEVLWFSEVEEKRRSLLSDNHIFDIPDPIMYILLDYYNNYIVDRIPPDNPNFTYSWEGEDVSKNSLKIAQYIANKTEILVLCGYSFPFVNSQIDKAILSNMQNVKYIYYQDYKKEDDLYFSIEDRLKQLMPQREQSEGDELVFYPKIRRIKYTTEFYIPPDLEL